jgi:hypothetical protein
MPSCEVSSFIQMRPGWTSTGALDGLGGALCVGLECSLGSWTFKPGVSTCSASAGTLRCYL